jgi:membrane fusion protein, multidrug efflux system
MSTKIFFVLLTSLAISISALAAPKKPQGMMMPPAVVEATKIVPTTYQSSATATGTLVAIPGIVIKSEIAGRITKLNFQSGTFVAAGTPLLEINSDILQATLEQSETDLQLKKVTFARIVTLYQKGAFSKADYDKAKADLDSARAITEQNKAKLKQAFIAAPFTGKLGLAKVNLGDFVNAGQEIVSLQSLDPIYIDFSVPETYLGQLDKTNHSNQKITFKSSTYPGQVFEGKIVAFESLINPSTRTLNIRAVSPNPDNKLVPGSFVEVSLFLGTSAPALFIPQTAVTYSPDGAFVYKVIDGHAVKTKVTLGDRTQEKVMVTDGLKEGDVIVSAGEMKIMADGAPVIIAPSSNQAVQQNQKP